MKKLNNIDEMLKETLADFKPEVPADAWGGIQQAMSQGAVTNGVTQSATTIKSVSLITKVVLSIAVPVTLAGTYFLYNTYSLSPEQKAPVSIEVSEVKPEIIMPSNEIAVQPESAKTPVKREVVTDKTGEQVLASSAKEKGPKHAMDVVKEYESGDQGSLQSSPSKQIILPTEEVSPVVPTDIKRQETPVRISSEKTALKRRVHPHVYQKEPEPIKRVDEPTVVEDKPQIPNVFTPNGDGANEHFVIQIENEIFYYLRVIDKNGATVFESNDKNVTWDGMNMKSGEPCEPGVYSYEFKYQLKNGQDVKNKNGSIQIIR